MSQFKKGAKIRIINKDAVLRMDDCPHHRVKIGATGTLVKESTMSNGWTVKFSNGILWSEKESRKWHWGSRYLVFYESEMEVIPGKKK